MNTLAIETSSHVCSVALSHGGRVLSQTRNEPKAHARLILSMVRSLLNEAKISINQIDRIVFGKGPGSFTGLRIAGSVVQGLSVAHNIPVCGISSLACLAEQSYREFHCSKVIVAIDARMDEVYLGEYKLLNHHMSADSPDRLVPIKNIRHLDFENSYLVGNAWLSYPQSFEGLGELQRVELDLDACDLLTLSPLYECDETTMALPHYLRDKVTQ